MPTQQQPQPSRKGDLAGSPSGANGSFGVFYFDPNEWGLRHDAVPEPSRAVYRQRYRASRELHHSVSTP